MTGDSPGQTVVHPVRRATPANPILTTFLHGRLTTPCYTGGMVDEELPKC